MKSCATSSGGRLRRRAHRTQLLHRLRHPRAGRLPGADPACGKYRFNKLDFGDIEGLPRLIDAGQCNDAYSAIILAVTTAEKLGCTVNDLPLSLVLSWFEQKAIVILLTLLSLGVKNITTGPTAPAFLTPDLLAILNEKFGLRAITDVEHDLQMMLNA